MNDVHIPQFDTIADDRIKEVADQRRAQRGDRRAAALNAVGIARMHGGRDGEPYSQSEADVIMAIMELLDRVAGG